MNKYVDSKWILVILCFFPIIGFGALTITNIDDGANAIAKIFARMFIEANYEGAEFYLERGELIRAIWFFSIIILPALSSVLIIFYLIVSLLLNSISNNTDELDAAVEASGKSRRIEGEIVAWLKTLYRQQRTLGFIAISGAIVSIAIAYSLFQSTVSGRDAVIQQTSISEPSLPLTVPDPDASTSGARQFPPRREVTTYPSGVWILYNTAGRIVVLVSALIIFGYAFGQYRRVDQRITELRVMLLATSFDAGKIQPDDFRKICQAVAVSNDVPRPKKGGVEFGLLDSISSSASRVMRSANSSEETPKAKNKSGKNDNGANKDNEDG